MVILNNSNSNNSSLAHINTSDPTNNRSQSSHKYEVNSFYLLQPPQPPPRTGLTAEKLNNYSRFLPSTRLQIQQQQHYTASSYIQTANRLVREQQHTQEVLEEKSTFIEFEPELDFIDGSKNDDSTTTTVPFLLPSQYIDLSLFFYSPPEGDKHPQQDSYSYQPALVSGSTSSSRRVLEFNNNNYIKRLNALHTSSDSSVLTASTTSASSASTTSTTSTKNNTSSDCSSVPEKMIMMPSQNQQQHQPTSILSSNGQHQQQQQHNFLSNSSSNGQHANKSSSNSNNNNSNHLVDSSGSDDHEDLLAEMELIERLPTQERLKQAKRRRALQLKKWSEYEKEYNMLVQNNNNFLNSANNGATAHGNKKKKVNMTASGRLEHQYVTAGSGRNIKFQDHVVLLDAIMRKDRDEVERLLRTGIAANAANEDGLTAIHQCCIDDSAELLLLLIHYGADVNVIDNDFWTPLHAAATCANLDICKILIESGADLLAVNTDGNMPYDICDDEVCLEFIESEMAARGITQQTIDFKRGETETKMLNDLKQVCFKQIAHVINYGKNGGAANGELATKLTKNNSAVAISNFLACFSNPITNDSKLDLNAKDHNGATLLHIACANGYNTIIEFLLKDCRVAVENGAPLLMPDLFARDSDGWTPLHIATFWGHQRGIELLLEYGADVNAKTNNDETVLDLCDDPDVRDFIVQKSREIETEQQKQAAARAAAAMQMKLQLINSSINNSSQTLIKNGGDKTNSSQNINNSTRSLKRTSTGVSRSSSVRRSSFRDKEKAKKLDTSFKDVLYANEINDTNDAAAAQTNGAINSNESSPVTTTASLKTNKDSPITNNNTANTFQTSNLVEQYYMPSTDESQEFEQKIRPVVINHNKEPEANQKQPNNVVKVVNGTTSNGKPQSSSQLNGDTVATPPKNRPSYDDLNNNQLKLNNNQLTTNTQQTVVARIHSNGAQYPTQQSAPTQQAALAYNINPIMSSSTNYSMTSSMVSNVSAPVAGGGLTTTISSNPNNNSTTNNTTLNNLLNNQHQDSSTFNVSNNTLMSASSIAIIDINSSKNNKNNNTDSITIDQSSAEQQTSLDTVDHTGGKRALLKNNTDNYFYNVNTSQPRTGSVSETGGGSLNQTNDSSVRYKFKSNETIGMRTNEEFDDINVKSSATKRGKCGQCLKCCNMM